MVTMMATVAAMRMITNTIPRSSCNGTTLGKCIEAKKEFEMDSKSNMEIFEPKKEIGNGAIGKNGIPCSKKNNTTKNCKPGPPANRYKRGCNPITQCRAPPPHG
ncbi:Rapid alkalinization factor [Arachis hypogaea]|nr:Rapid alkalinization factor [Arachis hypogaea]